jgi:hypothetical protein
MVNRQMRHFSLVANAAFFYSWHFTSGIRMPKTKEWHECYEQVTCNCGIFPLVTFVAFLRSWL